MALKHLTEEQVRDWTLEQKDRWWFENIWRGDMPQLTLRSAFTGFLLGSILSLTNLYVGAKTGWSLGVGITSVILSFGLWRALQAIKVASGITILENNCTQSIATAAGYMTAPMISSLAAYMMVTGEIVPMHYVMIWLISVAILGVLFAFPLKRRFINDEQHPFPEGRACGVVLDALHTSDPKAGMFKAKLLAGVGILAALLEFMKSGLMDKVKLGWMALPGTFDQWFPFLAKPTINGVSLKQLTVRPDTDFVMMAAGGLMGIRTGVSLLVGACISYLVLAPIFIANGDILPQMEGAIIQRDPVTGEALYGFRVITTWALWGGVAMMTTASLFSFFSKPQILISAFSGLFKFKNGAQAEEKKDVLAHIELPMRVFVLGIPIIGALVVIVTHEIFGVSYLMGAIAVPLVFVFTLIGVNSTALTAITPTGALGKLTQLTFGLLAPGNIKTNLMTAGITAETAGNASNLLMDIKPGYMLGAKPRQQAMGHVIGIFAGALASVPVFYLVFLAGDIGNLGTEQYPMPAAAIWKGVAEVLTQGLDQLPVSARWAALIGGIMGIVLELVKLATRNRFPLSAVGMGLAFVIPWNTCFAMFLGSFLFWLVAKKSQKLRSPEDPHSVKNQEPICAGIIAGGALMGIFVALMENVILANGGGGAH